jgi:hypothetical protein
MANDTTLLSAEPKATVRTAAAATPVAGSSPLSPYLPPDIIGGSVPHIAGTEEEAVWNAASQACATDKVHYAYSVSDGRIWYLSTPSSSLASNPDSWCPLVAALPGNSEYWDRETVYIYDQEGTAAGLRWDQETGRMQVFVGPSRTVLPRLQTLDANFVTINVERATPVPWKNRSLNEEKLSRATVMGLFWTGTALAIVAIGYWLLTHVISIAIKPNLAKAQQETAAASEKLMMQAAQMMRNDADKHVFRLQDLLMQLQSINGTLLKYQVKDGAVMWEALIPPAAGGENLKQLRAKAIGSSEDGRVKIQGTN